MRHIALLANLLATPANMQMSIPVDTSGLQAQIAAAQANSCQAAAAIPPAEAVGGAAGTGNTCRLANAIQPRITRAGVATTDANGNWSITWSLPLATPPVAYPIPINLGTQPIVCNVATSTATGATGRCWMARTLPATLTLLSGLVNYDAFGASASGISVQVLAIPVTQ